MPSIYRLPNIMPPKIASENRYAMKDIVIASSNLLGLKRNITRREDTNEGIKYNLTPGGERDDIMTEMNAPSIPAWRILPADIKVALEEPCILLTGDPQFGQYSASSGSGNPHFSQLLI